MFSPYSLLQNLLNVEINFDISEFAFVGDGVLDVPWFSIVCFLVFGLVIDKIKCIFLEKYNGETENFYSLYENIDDLKQGSKLLMHYVDESLKGENSMGGR